MLSSVSVLLRLRLRLALCVLDVLVFPGVTSYYLANVKFSSDLLLLLALTACINRSLAMLKPTLSRLFIWALAASLKLFSVLGIHSTFNSQQRNK